MDSEVKTGIYLPPAKRGGNREDETKIPRKKGETTIRISNLPESMNETDIQELGHPFGKVEGIHLPKDETTGKHKGFGFVTFQLKENAERAIRYLNGYEYDSHIFNVEWSKPQPSER